MRVVAQRVLRASVTVRGQIVASIANGLLVLVGVHREDTTADAEWLARKLAGLRVFGDASGKMSLSLEETGGALLAVPQFTLYGDCRRGRRPDFTQAAGPDLGLALFNHFCGALESQRIPVQKGMFREHMLVELANDGPVTLIWDTRDNPRDEATFKA